MKIIQLVFAGLVLISVLCAMAMMDESAEEAVERGALIANFTLDGSH